MAEGSVKIPKIIHYCWFGGKPLGKIAEKFVASWRRYCPDYKIIRWDESNCDISENRYALEAYRARKWAFVSDYFRLKVLYNVGGIYLDTDVELIRPIDNFSFCKAFLGFEDSEKIATCVMGSIPNHRFIETALEFYQGRKFVLKNGKFDLTTNVDLLTDILQKNGLKTGNIRQSVFDTEIFPSDFFSPKNLKTGKIMLTENTCAIHHFEASWQSGAQRLHTKVAQILGEKNTVKIKNLLGKK